MEHPGSGSRSHIVGCRYSLWVSATLLLRTYQEHFGSSRIYGQLNSVVTLLLWLDTTGAAIFIGGKGSSDR